MPTLDDEGFEIYLKQFRPLAAEPLPIESPGYAIRRQFVRAAWIMGTAVLIAAVLGLHPRPEPAHHSPNRLQSFADADQFTNQQPLTIGTANTLLTTAPSFKAAVDKMAFQFQVIPLPKGKHSALAVLSEEKTKL